MQHIFYGEGGVIYCSLSIQNFLLLGGRAGGCTTINALGIGGLPSRSRLDLMTIYIGWLQPGKP